jgi:ankyrin repeat protein
MKIVGALLITALLCFPFAGFSSPAEGDERITDLYLYHHAIAEALCNGTAEGLFQTLAETSAQIKVDFPSASPQQRAEIWEQVLHDSSALSESEYPLPLLGHLAHNPSIGEKEEKLRILVNYGLYQHHADLTKSNARLSNLDLLLSILAGSTLTAPLSYSMLASIEDSLSASRAGMVALDAALHEKNITTLLAKYHRSLWHKSLTQGAYQFARLLLDLVFRHQLEVFAPEQEAGTQVLLPVASPLLEEIAQAMAPRRKRIERHLQRLQLSLVPAMRHCNSFWEYAVKYLPVDPFNEKSKQRLASGLLSAFPLHTTALQSEVLHYIELGQVRTQFLKLAGSYYLAELLNQDSPQPLWDAIRYFNGKNSDFADVLAFSGERHLLLLGDAQANLLIKAARRAHLGGIQAMLLLAADAVISRDSRGDNVFHIVLGDKKNSEKVLCDFLKNTLYGVNSNRAALVEALIQQGAQHKTPLQIAAEMGYERCLKLLMDFLHEERAYDALEHGGASYDLFKHAVQAKPKIIGKKKVETPIMAGCKPIAPFLGANPKHQLLLQKISAQLTARLGRKLKAYQDSISEIYQPAFAELYDFFCKELPNFSLSSPELQMGYLEGPLRQIIEKIDFDCDGCYLNTDLRYSYLCAAYESKLPQKMREAIKSFLGGMVK